MAILMAILMAIAVPPGRWTNSTQVAAYVVPCAIVVPATSSQ